MVITHYLYLQIQFDEDRCTQFRLIVVTDPQTRPQTDRTDYNTWMNHEYLPTRNLRPATTVFSSHAFPVAAPTSVWNSLNIHTRSAETFLTSKSRLKLICSRPVTTPDFPASSQHRAPDSLAIDTRGRYTNLFYITNYITIHCAAAIARSVIIRLTKEQ